jgi:uncharacterized protein YqhQ
MSVHPISSKNIIKDLKAYIDSNTVVVGEFNIPLSPIDRSSNKKINKIILDQMYLTDVYRLLQENNIHSSDQSMELFQNRSYLLCKASFRKHKKIEISPCILSVHNALKLELNNNKKKRKYTNNCKLNNTFLNDQCAIKEIK